MVDLRDTNIGKSAHESCSLRFDGDGDDNIMVSSDSVRWADVDSTRLMWIS